MININAIVAVEIYSGHVLNNKYVERILDEDEVTFNFVYKSGFDKICIGSEVDGEVINHSGYYLGKINEDGFTPWSTSSHLTLTLKEFGRFIIEIDDNITGKEDLIKETLKDFFNNRLPHYSLVTQKEIIDSIKELL